MTSFFIRYENNSGKQQSYKVVPTSVWNTSVSEQRKKQESLEQQFPKHGFTDLWEFLSTLQGIQEVKVICLSHCVDICVDSANVREDKTAAMFTPIKAAAPNYTKSHGTLHYHTLSGLKKKNRRRKKETEPVSLKMSLLRQYKLLI